MDRADKKLIVPKSPTITLKGDKIDAYIKMLIKLIDGGRLNKYFPDQAALKNLLHFLIPANNYNMYDTLEINYDTGLPTEKEITRVIVDGEVALKTIKDENEATINARAKENPSEVNIRRQNRFLYHKDLLKNPLPKLMNLQLKLRKLDTEKYIAYFNVEIERFDMSANKFVKYTLVVGQEDAQWSRQHVLVMDDELKYTGAFRNLLSEYTVSEAEFAFILLNDLKDVMIEEVQRCVTGPLYFNGVNIPQGMEEIFKKHPDTFILSLPSDKASIYLKEDKNNDPLVQMYRDTLDPENRILRDKKAEQTGYHVFKERKFVCTKNAFSDFQKFLKEHDSRCVVYCV